MRDRFELTPDSADLDLLPVMNLFMVLIPFLLMGAAFYHIGAIPSSLPAHASGAPTDEEEPIQVLVNLQVNRRSLTVQASSDRLDDETLASLGAELVRTPAGYPLADLQKHLRRIKQAYPASDTAMVLPHDALDYESLVGILDASREFEDGTTPSGDPRYSALFPVVIFSRQLRAEEAPGAGAPSEVQP